jgi:hypothetical protein
LALLGREGLWGMIGVEKIGEIRRANFEQHRSIKEIVRTLSVSRATVRKWQRSALAIDQFEADFEQTPEDRADRQSNDTNFVGGATSPKQLILNDYDPPISYSQFPSSPIGPRHAWTLPTVAEHWGYLKAAVPLQRFSAPFWSTIQLVIAAALGAAIYTAIDGHKFLQRDQTPKEIVAANTLRTEPSNLLTGKNLSPRSEATFRPAMPSIPLPSVYGVYAISDGRLKDLDSLPIRVPDARVAISASFATPSRVQLPIGQLQFVVFRRDLLNNAPDHVQVRVVARVVRALTFDAAGKPTVADVDGSWVAATPTK